jgi:hypothetical protein
MALSSLVICPVAIDSNGVAHLGFGSEPEFKNYVESVFPEESVCSYNKWNNFVITADFSGVVKAADEIILPSGEKREFSYWMLEPENSHLTIHCKEMLFFKGQHGIVGMYYGVKKEFKPQYWSKLNMNEYEVWVSNVRHYNHNFLLPTESLVTV